MITWQILGLIFKFPTYGNKINSAILCIVLNILDHCFLKVYIFSFKSVIFNTILPNVQVAKRV